MRRSSRPSGRADQDFSALTLWVSRDEHGIPNGIALVLSGPAQDPVPGSLTVLKGTRHVKVVSGLGVFPIDVKVTPNGRFTWVTNNQAGTVSLFPTPR